MLIKWSRRKVVSGLGAGALAAAHRKAWAQTVAPGQGLLARLQAARSATVGLAAQMPGSFIEPDGTLNGIAPTFASRIMERLGVPQVKGVAATYGELIPGMQAGRWDFIAAALTVTKARCEQVLYSDPILFDGGSFFMLKGSVPNPPKLVSEMIARKFTAASMAGGAHARFALEHGIDPANLLQFPSDGAIMDGLLAKRAQIAFGSLSTLTLLNNQRKIEVDVVFPVADEPSTGQGCAFRLGDTDLHQAFQKELRAMKASGEYLEISRKFGFDPPAELIAMTDEKICQTDR